MIPNSNPFQEKKDHPEEKAEATVPGIEIKKCTSKEKMAPHLEEEMVKMVKAPYLTF